MLRPGALVQLDLTIYINNNSQLFALKQGGCTLLRRLDRAVQVALSR